MKGPSRGAGQEGGAARVRVPVAVSGGARAAHPAGPGRVGWASKRGERGGVQLSRGPKYVSTWRVRAASLRAGAEPGALSPGIHLPD